MDDLQGMEARLEAMERRLNTVDEIVRGNGEPSKGLVAKVGRLTEWMKQMKWGIGATVLAAITVIASTVDRKISQEQDKQIKQLIELIKDLKNEKE